MANKDDIISAQLEVIRAMTEKNMKSVGADLFGAPSLSNKSEEIKEEAKKETQAEEMAEKAEKEDIEALKKELSEYIGLEKVKSEVSSLINLATVYALRLKNDLPTPEMSLHLVFSGNPGTGKTMIARFMARVYHSLDLLSKGQLVEVDRSSLVAGYVGQTAQKTMKALESALGGVLFIDEAYALTSKSENDYGLEAVETILKYMEDHRDDIVVIIAGYSDLMKDFIDSNPGLQSRFNKYIDFEDYTPEEMLEIFKTNCRKGQYELDADAEATLLSYFCEKALDSADFGNARGVRNTFEKILSAQANRIAHMTNVSKDDLVRLTKEDAENGVK
ncbi:MAG: AAA family ATPase [Clostridia bacterium]|nr:AAA family ATPase [Clostridia bacterium]